MDYYVVTNRKSPIQILCRKETEESARVLYNSIVRKFKYYTKVSVCNWYKNITLKDNQYVLFTDIAVINDLYTQMQDNGLKVESLKRANAEMHLNCKYLQVENKKLQDELEDKDMLILALKKDSKSKSEKLARALTKAVAQEVKTKA